MTEPWSLDGAFEFFAGKLHEYDVNFRNDEKQSGGEVSRTVDEGQDDGKLEEKDRYSEDSKSVCPCNITLYINIKTGERPI
jgi:hypothetical protein